MKPVIQLDKVTKMYGSSLGVSDISLKVPEGSVFGFLGPNGAGKTTTISMLMSLIAPTHGKITIFGQDVQSSGEAIRKEIGFLSSDMPLDDGFTGWQEIEYYGKLRGGLDRKYVRELAKRLNCNLNRKFKTLSRGNQQKVALIIALMHKPKLLVLDEPTSGLDPLVQAEFNKLISEHKAAGNTAFVSSHILSEVQEICDEVAFIRAGRMIAQKSLQDLLESKVKKVNIISDDSRLKDSLASLKGVDSLRKTRQKYELHYTGDAQKLVRELARHKIDDVNIQEADLESVFMRYYREEKNA